MHLELPDDCEIVVSPCPDGDLNWRKSNYETFVHLRQDLRDAKHSGCTFRLVFSAPKTRINPSAMSYQQIDEVARRWAEQVSQRAIIERRMSYARRNMRKAALGHSIDTGDAIMRGHRG